MLGGGVFGNEIEWIAEAIEYACSYFKDLPLDVCLVLYDKSKYTPPQQATLEQLEGVLRHDAAANHDRIVTVFSEPAGWTFGCDEQLQASPEIQQCLSNHEAICYRAPDEGGRCW